jgi:nitrogen regulatory protein P-II 1
MITEVTGQGAQGGIKQIWRGEKFQMDIIPKVCIDMVVNDSDVELAIDTIVKHARTGEIGDGKIFVLQCGGGRKNTHRQRNEQALCPSEADEKLKAIG